MNEKGEQATNLYQLMRQGGNLNTILLAKQSM